MKKGFFKSLLLSTMGGLYAFCATAATSLFSDYGQIQNVQHYSSNPFWTPNAPYNQRLPQPVYVQGADLNDEDCFKVVQSLVSVQCMARDNCKNTTLAEIRPTVMVQLSNLPGNNYVSACSGYIDTVFESYVAQYGNAMPNRAVSFPGATTPNQNLNDNNGIQIQNPYQQIPSQWQQDIINKNNELQQLQRQNGAGTEHVSAASFPTTFEDLSFSERMAIKAEGYEPYKDASAYVIPNFVSYNEWCNGTGKGSPECTGKTVPPSSGGNGNGGGNGNNGGNGNTVDPNPEPQKNYRIAFMVINDGTKKVDDVLTWDEPNFTSKTWMFNDSCSDHIVWANIGNSKAINIASRKVFSEYGGNSGDFFLDFQTSQDPLIFPGLILVGKGAGGTWTSPRTYAARIHYHIVMFNDSETAQKKLTYLKDYLKGGACSGLYIYLVALDVDDNNNIEESVLGSSFEDNAIYSGWSNIKESKIKKVKILSGPEKI